MSANRGVIATILLVLFGLTGLTGCADVSDVWTQDLVKAGFTDPVPIKDTGGSRRGHHGFGRRLQDSVCHRQANRRNLCGDSGK